MQSNSRLQVCACPVILMWSSPSLSPPFLLCRHILFWVCDCLCVSQVRTRDLGGYSTTGDFVRAVVENLRHRTVWRSLWLSIPDHIIHATSESECSKTILKQPCHVLHFLFPFHFLLFHAGFWFMVVFVSLNVSMYIYCHFCLSQYESFFNLNYSSV